MEQPKLYRLFTEDKNRPTLFDLVNCYFPGFTAYPTMGYWQKKKEESLCIEIVTAESHFVYTLAENIKDFNNQESVLVQELSLTSRFI
jgi:hypothetical protein